MTPGEAPAPVRTVVVDDEQLAREELCYLLGRVGGVEVVGDELVTANIRAYRKLGDDELDITMVMTHRFVDGKVVRGTDMVPSSFEAFWSRIGITV